jgi:hypothetical protein
MRTLQGLVKWAVETIKFIFDEMFDLSDQFKTRPIDREDLFQASKTNWTPIVAQRMY